MDQHVEIITKISEHDRSSVYLAMDDSGNPRILKKLSDSERIPLLHRIKDMNSPFFPTIQDISTEDGFVYVLEEYIEGNELSRVLSDGTLSGEEAVSLMEQLLEAVRVLHGMNPPVLHRDIKPENILVTKDGRLKLLDFDAAREWDDSNKASDTVLLGTRGYAAPEQFGYSQTDVRSDLYSVGIVCSMICERSRISEEKKDRLKAFLDRATMFDPDERFQSADEMLTALKKADNPDKGKRRRRLIGTAAAVCILAVGVILFIVLHSFTGVYNLDILPDDFRNYTMLVRIRQTSEKTGLPDGGYPGLVIRDDEGNSNDSDRPLLRYLKNDPQAILFFDYHFQNNEVNSVRLNRYSDDGNRIADRLRLNENTDFIIDNGLFCITVEALSRLQNGRYTVTVTTALDYSWEYGLMISDDAENAGDIDIVVLAPVQYYSFDIMNDVLFNIFNLPFRLDRVYCNGEPVSRKLYGQTEDGHGIVLRDSFFADYSTEDRELELTFETRDGRKAYGRVILVP